MDAFSVSMANGLAEPGMSRRKMGLVAGTYAGFQFLMPLTGWICVHTIASRFRAFERMIPWIALLLLAVIGGRMLAEGIRDGKGETVRRRVLRRDELLLQGVATSIDALSVGFTIAGYALPEAILCSVLIAAVTFGLCLGGLVIGRRVGNALSGRAQILGGVILIAIGAEIFIKGVLF